MNNTQIINGVILEDGINDRPVLGNIVQENVETNTGYALITEQKSTYCSPMITIVLVYRCRAQIVTVFIKNKKHQMISLLFLMLYLFLLLKNVLLHLNLLSLYLDYLLFLLSITF